MDLREQINMERLPSHVAIIMDGNGRWAKKYGKPRVFGHRSGVKAVREITEVAAELGVSYLTLYAFSTENWNRPRIEVNALMSLLVETLRKEIKTLNNNNIKLNAIGDLTQLPKRTYDTLMEGVEKTKNNSKMVLNLALNYSGRWEILEAVKSISERVKNGELNSAEIDSQVFSDHLMTKGIPDPELLIRTSGEYRISNYLLWQIAYSELYFAPMYWPDFREEDFYKAIIDYQSRERRFGKTSEQIS